MSVNDDFINTLQNIIYSQTQSLNVDQQKFDGLYALKQNPTSSAASICRNKVNSWRVGSTQRERKSFFLPPPSQMIHQFLFKRCREIREWASVQNQTSGKFMFVRKREKWTLHEHAEADSLSRPIIFKMQAAKRAFERSMCICRPRIRHKSPRLEAPASDASRSSYWFSVPIIVHHTFYATHSCFNDFNKSSSRFSIAHSSWMSRVFILMIISNEQFVQKFLDWWTLTLRETM